MRGGMLVLNKRVTGSDVSKLFGGERGSQLDMRHSNPNVRNQSFDIYLESMISSSARLVVVSNPRTRF
jgi:hypothetical protein